MLNSCQAVDNFGSNQENLVVKLPISNEDTFAILNFSDLDFCSSPCLDDHLMFSYPKLSQKIHTMDQNMPRSTGRTVVNQSVSDGEEYFPSGSALADLSPGVEFADIDTLLKDPRNPADFLNIDEVGLFLDGGLKDSQDLNANVDSFGPPSTIETEGIGADWLTNSIVICPNQLKYSRSDVFEDGSFAGNPSGKTEKVWMGLLSELDYDNIEGEEDM